MSAEISRGKKWVVAKYEMSHLAPPSLSLNNKAKSFTEDGDWEGRKNQRFDKSGYSRVNFAGTSPIHLPIPHLQSMV